MNYFIDIAFNFSITFFFHFQSKCQTFCRVRVGFQLTLNSVCSDQVPPEACNVLFQIRADWDPG